MSKLSFEEDELKEDFEIVNKESLFKKPKKNPSVDTSFLPDKIREEYELKERIRLKEVWIVEQDQIKEELVMIHFSFW